MAINVENYIRSLEAKALPRLQEVLIEALNDFAKIVIDASQPLVPVKTGDLKASWFIEPASASRGLRATVGYGGGDVDYAVFVHELYKNEKTGTIIKHSQGRWKYLETAMQSSAPELHPFIAQRLQEKMGAT